MKVLWSEQARAQAREIFTSIARERPNVAEQILERFIERTSQLSEFPEQGQPWGRPFRSDLRSLLSHSFRIIYSVGDDAVYILSVRHTRIGGPDVTDLP